MIPPPLFTSGGSDKDTPDDRIYTSPYDVAVKKIKLKQEQIIKKRTEQAQRKKLASWSEKCVAFGYELRSEPVREVNEVL